MAEKLGVNFKKPTTWIVIAFIILAGWMFSKEASAAETSFELAPGTMFVAGSRYAAGALFIEERWLGKYAVGFGLTTAWECLDNCKRGNGPTNQVVFIQRIVTYKKFELGLGLSYWHNTTPAWNSHTPFALSIGWNFNDHWSIKERHFSTAGSSSNNGGLDMLTIGYRF